MLTPHGSVYNGTTHVAFRDLLSPTWEVQPYGTAGEQEALKCILVGGRAAILFTLNGVICGPTQGLEIPRLHGVEALLYDLRTSDPMHYTIPSEGNRPQITVPGKVFVEDFAMHEWCREHDTMPEHNALIAARRKLRDLPVILIHMLRGHDIVETRWHLC